MSYEENIKSYFYSRRNLGLCYKPNMLQTPFDFFPASTQWPMQGTCHPCTPCSSAVFQTPWDWQVPPMGHSTHLCHSPGPSPLSLSDNPFSGCPVQACTGQVACRWQIPGLILWTSGKTTTSFCLLCVVPVVLQGTMGQAVGKLIFLCTAPSHFWTIFICGANHRADYQKKATLRHSFKGTLFV